MGGRWLVELDEDWCFDVFGKLVRPFLIDVDDDWVFLFDVLDLKLGHLEGLHGIAYLEPIR